MELPAAPGPGSAEFGTDTHPGKGLEYRPRACASTGQTVPGTPGLYLGQMIGSQDTGFVPGTTWFVPLTLGLCPGHLVCTQDKWFVPRTPGSCPGQFVPRIPSACSGQLLTRTICTQDTCLKPWTNDLYPAHLVHTQDSCFILRIPGLYPLLAPFTPCSLENPFAVVVGVGDRALGICQPCWNPVNSCGVLTSRLG